MHPQFARRRRDRLPQNHKPAELFQRLRKVDLFAGEVLLVESTNGAKVLCRREQECSGAEIKAKIESRKDSQKHAAPSRDLAVERNTRAATGRAAEQSVDRAVHVRRRNMRVSVNEEEYFAT